MRRLALGSLGGTLSMRVDAADVGIVPKVSAQMLAEVVPGLGRLAMVQTHTLGLSPSGGSVLATPGTNVQLDAGTVLRVRFDSPVTIGGEMQPEPR